MISIDIRFKELVFVSPNAFREDMILFQLASTNVLHKNTTATNDRLENKADGPCRINQKFNNDNVFDNVWVLESLIK